MAVSTNAKLAAAALALCAGGGALLLYPKAAPPIPPAPAPAPAPAPVAAPLYAWVQLDGGTTASVRAIMASGAAGCPALSVDGVAKTMTQRGASPAGFTGVFVCEHTLSAAPKSLAIGALTLPAPTFNAKSALVLGDTGCRETSNKQQPCTGDPSTGAWGFPALSKAAASTTPDFVLHVGDYLYRESDCKDTSACGYVWGAWEADFFKAAEAGGLLRLAPWVPVRGNHETCGRAWAGYSLFFAPGPMSTSACPTSIPPYSVSLNGLTLFVVDTSADSGQQAQADYSQVATALSGVTTPVWLTTHVPVCSDALCGGSMASAFQGAGLDKVSALRWLHVGHVHLYDHSVAGAHHPAQTVSGGGGTALNHPSSCVDTNTADCVTNEYTYMTVTASAGAWDATVYDQSGAKTGITFSVSASTAPGGH